MDKDIQNDIDQNLQLVEKVSKERDIVRRLEDTVDRLKKAVVTTTVRKLRIVI